MDDERQRLAMSYAPLMDRYCAGDTQAFRALYDALAPRVLAYLVSLVRDRTVAEDLLQLTFLKLHRARGQYVAGADPVPWIFAIAHRTFLDEMRGRRRARVRVSATGVLPELEEPSLDALLDARARQASVEAALGELQGALDALPTGQRAAIVLARQQGLAMSEVATVLGTTTNAVKQRTHRAYAALRARLESHFDADADPADRDPHG